MRHIRYRLSASILLAAGLLLPGAASVAPAGAQQKEFANVTPVFTAKLPNVSGKRLTAVVVRYAPGGSTPPHHHAGSVFAYVLSGTIRSQNSATGPARDYNEGQSFFEPPSSEHLISANASKTKPASLLAVFVADDGAVLTVPGK